MEPDLAHSYVLNVLDILKYNWYFWQVTWPAVIWGIGGGF